MTVTKTNIVNQALIKIGCLVVTDVDTDSTKRATTMKEIYDIKRNWLLRKYPWKFAIKRVTWRQPDDHFIEVNDEANAITFKLQNGPINGCQVDTIIEAAMMVLEGLNEKFPCVENQLAINRLEEALIWLEARTSDRKRRGVEGTNQE